MDQTPILFQCSHRNQGNSNSAVASFSSGMRAEGGEGHVYSLRKLDIKPCRACGMCAKDPASRCPLGPKDYAADVFADMLQAPFLFFAAPIYFYHLPSRLKLLIDRSQWIYSRRMKGDPEIVNLPKRPAYVALFAGRPQGEKLFEGSLLTLKYFLESFNFEIKEALTF
ncbi:MAG: flavodoxin family protein, partial [Desulfovibrionaceae bacterium]